MEKTSNTILTEMRQAVASLREQLDSLEAQMASLELSIKAEIAEAEAVASEAAAQAAAAEPEIQAAPVAPVITPAEPVEEPAAEAPVAEPVAEPAAEPDDMPFYDDADIPASPAPAAVAEEIPVVEEAPIPEPAPAPAAEETLMMEEVPEPIDLGISDFNIGDIDISAANINDAEAVNVKPAVMDVMAEKCAWKTDMPGTPVKNVLSAISLNDRILFVKALFGEDAALFQQTIQIFNTYTTLDEAEAYVRTNFRNWDMNSDVVYRFMMAVRRKLK